MDANFGDGARHLTRLRGMPHGNKGSTVSRLEDLTTGASVRGILRDYLVTVVSAESLGSNRVERTCKEPSGKPGNECLYRHDEVRTEVAGQRRLWSFDGDGALFRLVSEACRTRLPHMLDSILAVHTKLVEPLPHQLTAVYDTNVATCERVRLYAAGAQKGHDQNIRNGFAQ